MTHQILLVTGDPALDQRVRHALPAGIPAQLRNAPRYCPCSDPRGWLLVLLDVQALRLPPAPSPLARPDPEGPVHLVPQPCGPVLWLGEPPLLLGSGSEAALLLGACAGRVVDYLDRNLPPSKLGFILHQHLAGACLRRLRLPPPAPGPSLAGDELRRRLNNVLTGILGNAELAMDSSRRLPPPLGQRLQCIAELAGQMRDLLGALPQAATLPRAPASEAA